MGLDRTEVADQLRGEMGGQRSTTTTTEVFEPADPRRTMPKSLVIGAIFAVILLVVLMSWLNRRSLEQPDETASAQAAKPEPAAQETPAPPPAPAAGQPVVLTATDAVWLQVTEKGGQTLFSGVLQPGQTYAVPSTATAPLLKTGKPEALRVTVGNTVAPPVGPAATTVSNVSLLAADLLKPGQAGVPPPPAASPTTASTPRSTSARPQTSPPQSAPPAAEPAEAPTNDAAAT